MYPRTNYEMSEDDLNTILDASKPTPAMWGSGGAPMFDTPQENANRAWKALGEKMGFVWDSCQPISGKGMRFFSAIPSENETQMAERKNREADEKRLADIAELERQQQIISIQLAALKAKTIRSWLPAKAKPA